MHAPFQAIVINQNKREGSAKNLPHSSDDRVAKRKRKALFSGQLFVLVHPTKYVLDSTSDPSSQPAGDEFCHLLSSRRLADLDRAKADVRLRSHQDLLKSQAYQYRIARAFGRDQDKRSVFPSRTFD